MHRTTRTNPTTAIAVRAQMARAETRAAVRASAQRRLAVLEDERGAQAAEYAMLGGVSAAACGALVTILRNPDLLGSVVETVVTVLGRAVRAWF